MALNPTPEPELSADTVADIEEAFLGYWPVDLANVFLAPYEPGALRSYARTTGYDLGGAA